MTRPSPTTRLLRRPPAPVCAVLAAMLLGGIAGAAVPPAMADEPSPSNIPAASRAELSELLSGQASWTVVNLLKHRLPRVPKDAFDRYMMWNEIALDTTAIDHTPVAEGEVRTGYAEQFGPHRASRAMAIVHIAMFEAVNAVTHKFHSYAHVAPTDERLSLDRAIIQSAHDSLLALYPAQQARLDALFAQDAANITGTPRQIAAGKSLGAQAAAAILALRAYDGSELPEQAVGTGPDDFHVTPGAGYWAPDPVSGLQITFGSRWGSVTPFTLRAGDQFRPPPPPALTSAVYATAYNGVLSLGGDPTFGTPTTRTERQTFIGRFWGYDGTPSLCAPPRLYNMVARAVALQQGMNDVSELARYLALINTAMGDAGVAAWESKWHYQFWRPVTGIRNAAVVGNPATIAVPTWYPTGAPATNTRGPNFTPPFPAYPSGHATFGAAIFQVMRAYWPDHTRFTIVSDEYNGVNRDADGSVRPLLPETFNSFTEAEYDNAESRIYNGVHWEFDATAGIDTGRKVADWVLQHAFRRMEPHRS